MKTLWSNGRSYEKVKDWETRHLSHSVFYLFEDIELLNKRIAELTNENEALSEALDFEREHSESKITELESVADNQIWPSLGDGWSADYVRGYEQATHDMARKLKGGDV